MTYSRANLSCFRCGSFLFTRAIPHSQLSGRLYKRMGGNAHMGFKQAAYAA